MHLSVQICDEYIIHSSTAATLEKMNRLVFWFFFMRAQGELSDNNLIEVLRYCG